MFWCFLLLKLLVHKSISYYLGYENYGLKTDFSTFPLSTPHPPPLEMRHVSGFWDLSAYRCKRLTLPSLPRILCFSEPKYFLSTDEKPSWLTAWSQVSSAAVLTASDVPALLMCWRVTADWQPRTGRGADGDCLVCAVYAALRERHCHLNPFAGTAPSARLEKHLLAQRLEAAPLPGYLPGDPKLGIWMGEKRDRILNVSILKYSLIPLLLSTKKYSKWGLFNPSEEKISLLLPHLRIFKGPPPLTNL